MTCDETPDDGSSAGVHNVTWNNLKIKGTNITYVCPVGQAFDTIFNQTVNSTCNYQTAGAAQVSWTYSSSSQLPPCIRESLKLRNAKLCNMVEFIFIGE